MKREMSEVARCAKEIRQYIKSLNIPCRVKSHSYSMGCSVRVELDDLHPDTEEKIKSHTAKYQYGHFDGMIDLYEYSNTREDIPQTKFLFINNHYSKKLKQAAWEFFKSSYTEAAEGPELLEDEPY